MANGEVVADGNKGRHIILLDAVAGNATNNGAWVELQDHRLNVSIWFDGIAGGASLSIRGSNATAKPAATEHGDAIGAAVDADGFVAVNIVPRWIKVYKAAATGSGTVTAILAASK